MCVCEKGRGRKRKERERKEGGEAGRERGDGEEWKEKMEEGEKISKVRPSHNHCTNNYKLTTQIQIDYSDMFLPHNERTVGH